MRDPDYVRLDPPLIPGLRGKQRPDNWPEKTDIVWKKFVVPQDVLDKPSPVTASKAGILNLPTELVLKIFSHASQESGICLALTCKSLLVASTLANLQRPTLPPENRIPFSDYEGAILHPGHRQPEYLSRRVVIMFSFLIRPLDDRLRRSHRSPQNIRRMNLETPLSQNSAPPENTPLPPCLLPPHSTSLYASLNGSPWEKRIDAAECDQTLPGFETSAPLFGAPPAMESIRVRVNNKRPCQ
ncbi:hypothetical protein J3E69DRAFT_362706 [Trichoderma sp. SZMC 28015]